MFSETSRVAERSWLVLFQGKILSLVIIQNTKLSLDGGKAGLCSGLTVWEMAITILRKAEMALLQEISVYN